ncbi:MAG: cytochrome c3 family protein [Raoultibacter sp.]|jgi:hypothetical protein
MIDEKNDTLHNDVEDIQTTQDESTAKPKRSKKKLSIVLAVTLVVLVLAGSGFYVWHEQPSFCNAICHEPMDEYVESYYAHDEDLLVTAHAEYGVSCLDCHEAKMSDQVGMAISWVEGAYTMPLEEIHYEDEFCLNERCHNMTREELANVYVDQARNPHEAVHGEIACENCHYSHTQSVNFCSQCHDDAYVPDGWLTAQEAAEMGVRDYINIQPKVVTD